MVSSLANDPKYNGEIKFLQIKIVFLQYLILILYHVLKREFTLIELA